MSVLYICLRYAGVFRCVFADGHSVPDAVDCLGLELREAAVPLNREELRFNTELFAERFCKLRVESGPLTVFLIVHRLVFRNTDDKLFLSGDVCKIRRSIAGVVVGVCCGVVSGYRRFSGVLICEIIGGFACA